MSFRLVIPWRVALQQSSPPLHQPPPGCNRNDRLSIQYQRTATLSFCRVSAEGFRPFSLSSGRATPARESTPLRNLRQPPSTRSPQSEQRPSTNSHPAPQNISRSLNLLPPTSPSSRTPACQARIEMRSSTESQTAASRVNGAKSHGPVSPEGKAKCSRNAVRHGLSSRRILVDGESEDDLNALRVHWMRQLQPLTPAERETAEEVVAAQWRIRRCQETESALFSVEIKKLGVDASDSEALAAAFKTLADTSKAL